MSKPSLTEPYRQFCGETEWLMRECLSVSVKVSPNNLEARIIRLPGEMAIIRLLDSWARFSRELIVMSAGCRPYTASGVKLPRAPGIKQAKDVIPVLKSRYPNSHSKSRSEPNWHVANDCIEAADKLRVANYHTIKNALGATGSPVPELRLIRNFFAHRNQLTAAKVRNWPRYSRIARVNFENIATIQVPPGITVIEDWIIQLRLMAYAAIQ